MKKKTFIAAALTAVAVLGSTVFSGVASAAPEPTGWDDVNDQVVGSGSDTTYAFMQRYERLYNQANGCDTDNVVGSPTLGNCLTPAQGQSQTDPRGNWDHDYFVGKFPNGSSAGVKALQLGQVDYARSSRGPKASGESDLNFWAFGKDGLAMVTFGTRTPGNLTKAQIQGIYNCTITTWDQITNNPADAGQLIEPIANNPSSGTFASMETYLGFNPNNGACVKKLSSGLWPFENDAKPIIADPGINEDNAFWWMSFGEYRAYSYKRQSAKTWTVDGVAVSSGTITNNSYPATRFIYHVTTKASTTAPGGTDDLSGADGGKAGAVREMTEFMCKASGNHMTNDFTGRTNYVELTDIYSQTGFVRLPVSERTNGVCRLVPGA